MQKNILENLFRADLYRLLALGFDEPCEANLESVTGIAKDLLKLNRVGKNATALGLLANTPTDNTGNLAAEYHRLFGTQVRCPASEGSYQQVERGPIIGDVSAFYEAFHMKVIEQKGPPDSLKMELGFMSFMALKTYYALEKGLQEEQSIVKAAQARFLAAHLGRWIKPFVTKLREVTSQSWYQNLANLLEAAVEEDCRNLNVNPVPLPGQAMEDEGDVCCSLGTASRPMAV